ncbi:MAG: FtsX-like permease family protein [Bacteroidales bacterium]
MQPVRKIHLHSDLQYEIQTNGNSLYVYVFGIVAIFIILMACINFTNLATARAANRAKEVGIRKVLGSGKGSLVLQFILEAVAMSLMALLMGLLMAELFMPQFRNLIGLPLDISYANVVGTWGVLFILALIVGFIAGSYPAFFLASFQPAQVLKGKVRTGAKSGLLRSVLVVFQFVISMAILLGSFVVFQQLSFIQSKDPGYTKEQVLVLRRSDALGSQMEAFKQELEKLPHVAAVTNCNTFPGRNFSNNAFFLEGNTNTYLIYQAWTSFGVKDVFQYKLKEGRFHSRQHPSDSNGIVINEAAVRSLGFEEALGQQILQPRGEGMQPLEVIGVMEDFHFKSIHHPVEPAGYTLMDGNWEGFVMIKLSGDQGNAIRAINDLWETFTAEYPFEYFFFEDDYNQQYIQEVRTSKVMGVFAFLSVLIAAMGLLGLISFLTNERQKEVGIRKSYGASALQVVFLFSWHIIRLVIVAWILAVPLAYIWAQSWLSGFAFRIQMPYAIYLVIPLLVVVFSFVVVAWQTIRAARQNPARILRYE